MPQWANNLFVCALLLFHQKENALTKYAPKYNDIITQRLYKVCFSK